MVATGQDRFRIHLGCLVSDPQSHVVRLVSPQGEVSTPWGQPDQAGHLDAPSAIRERMAALFDWLRGLERPPRRSLFNQPSFLCSSPLPFLSRDRTWKRVLVSDSGNHVIRALYPDGQVETLAGVPGQAGHRDAGSGRQALFNNPQGLAEDHHGTVYVADQGNGVIRCISPQGRVRTLAGSPGAFGSQDGVGAAARFRNLRGLALSYLVWPYPALFAADGHAIRRITPIDRQVTTVLGVVDQPGFQDVPEDLPLSLRRKALVRPGLNTPCGIQATPQGLFG